MRWWHPGGHALGREAVNAPSGSQWQEGARALRQRLWPTGRMLLACGAMLVACQD